MTQTDHTRLADAVTGPGEASGSSEASLSEAARVPVAAAPPVRGNRLAALDGLRFLAALAVGLFHFMEQTPGPMPIGWGRPQQEPFPREHG